MPAKSALPDHVLEEAAECLRALAHPVRLRICEVLAGASVTVSELAERVGLGQAAVSQHLSLMKAHGLLRAVREGRCVYYEIQHPQCTQILLCMQQQYAGERKKR